MREQFEKLPEVKKRLISVKFNEALNRYESKNPVLIECLEVALFLNGAWMMHQEQQKKNEALAHSIMNKTQMAHEYAMQHLENSGGKITMYSLCLFAWEYADAMQAEADKRSISLTKDKDGNCLHFHREFGHQK